MRAGESVVFSNIGATTAAFTLRGGKYGVSVVATGSGTVTLQKRLPNGTSYATALTAFSATTGYASVDLPPGAYKIAIATFTAVYVEIQRIPGE